jgi:hypothetical protein
MKVHRSYNHKIMRWTQQAIDCFNRGCVCAGCPVYEYYFKETGRKCRMKAAVIESVRLFGAPPNRHEDENGNIL